MISRSLAGRSAKKTNSVVLPLVASLGAVAVER